MARRRWSVVVAAAFAVSALAVPPSMAAEPDPPDPTSAVLRVSVGGDRTGDGPGDVSGLDGVVLGAFSETSSTDPVATCTSVAGVCSLIIPDTAVGRENYNKQFWIRHIEAPTGWYDNPQLRTGSSTVTKVLDYEFQTPKLTDRVYESGDLLTSDGMTSGTSTASLGHWQQSRKNPELKPKCGIGRVLILTDWSNSVKQSPGFTTLITTLDQFADAFAGTAASLSFAAFGFQQIGSTSDFFKMSTSKGVEAFKLQYAGWDQRNLGSQGTNWDAGLRAVADARPDLVIMLTDGNPTAWGPGPTGASDGGVSTQFADVEAAIFAANTLKSAGARVVALGVGDGVSPDVRAEMNLQAISGPTKFEESNPNYLTADYFQTPTYDAAAEAFRQMALASCEGSLSVVKQIVPPGGKIADAVAAGPGWQFTVSGDGVTDASGTTTADQSGMVVFDLKAEDPVTDLKISEQQLDGYTLLPADGTEGGPRAVCTPVGSDVIRDGVANDPDDPFGVILKDVAVEDEAITCTFYNQAPKRTTSVQVDKRWVINGQPVANGGQPSGLEADLKLAALPGAPGSSQQVVDDAQFGEKYLKYPKQDGGDSDFMAADDVVIGETVTAGPHCQVDPLRTTIHALKQETDGGDYPLLEAAHKVNLSADPEWNHFVVTNYAECDPAPRWTLSKTSDPASGATVQQGDPVTYTVTATNLEQKVTPQNLTIVDDLSEVLKQAEIDRSSIVASAGSASLTGTELVWTLDALETTATLTYRVVMRQDADDGATIANSVYGKPSGEDSGGVPPEQCQEDDPCPTVHFTPRVLIPGQVYDVALREWVGEVYRDQRLVHQLFPFIADLGPDYGVPYVGFDNPDYDALPGDLTVHDINLFNQGSGVVRIDEVVGYLPTEGLALADPAAVAAIVPVDGPITNEGWTQAADGSLRYDPAGPIVIQPGGTARVTLTLEVGAVPASGTAPYALVDMYVEIAEFSGWVPENAGADIDPDDPLTGRNGSWAAVEDVDSHPDAVNDEPVTNHYKNHVIDEHAFADVSGTRTLLAAVDEDDHDGAHLRVMRQAVLPDPEPADGSQPGGSRGSVAGFLASTGGSPWLIAGIALVVMVAGWAAFAWSRRWRSAGR